MPGKERFDFQGQVGGRFFRDAKRSAEESVAREFSNVWAVRDDDE
jgi:hypothetical protein